MLKEYQKRVDQEVEGFLSSLALRQKNTPSDYAEQCSQITWEKDCKLGEYKRRTNGIGQDLPNFCIKVPTGGGKTLLATQILGSIYRTILADQNGAGLVLWVVPSSQIYRDTIKRLSDRRDLYRVMLEHSLSRRIEIWEKDDIARLTPTRLRECLNILILQLASTNRETKEQLKFFRDSGGNIVQHFPPEDDAAAQKALKEKIPNLDMIVHDEDSGQHLVKTSIGNLVRLCRPAVILDEGHKATSLQARETLEGFNASIIVELSATPRVGTNIISRVTGKELLDEEMIKLPLNIATSKLNKWEDVVTQARDKRESLAVQAADLAAKVDPELRIRPIVLIQAERTGAEQEGKGKIHANQVADYLTQHLGVARDKVKIKSAENDGLEDVDLMDPDCAVEWIITKSALQEGWDCPFAYILVSLSSTGSSQNMTQLVGRVLRQPYQRRAPDEYGELNESYVYCLHATSGEIAKQVKKALEQEGYEGEGLVVDASGRESTKAERIAAIRPEFSSLYKKPFAGKIYLPRFCVRTGKGKAAQYEPLDYFRHLISRVDVERFEYGSVSTWQLNKELLDAKDRFYRVTLGTELTRVSEKDTEVLETDEEVLGWMTASLRFDFFSQKDLGIVAQRVYQQIKQADLLLQDRLALVKFVVRNKTEAFIQEQLDKQTEAAFDELFAEDRIEFYLACENCRYEIPASVPIKQSGTLQALMHDDGNPVQRSLFDFVDHHSCENNFERAIALCLDKDADVLWWYRNLVGDKHFHIQGYRKQKVFPDFLVHRTPVPKENHLVLVLEGKGDMRDVEDTEYKRNLADLFSQTGKRVPWQKLGEEFRDHVFKFEILDESEPDGRDWKDKLRELLR